MSNREQTAGETATDNSKSFTVNDITFTNGDDRVTIEITGKAFANLCENHADIQPVGRKRLHANPDSE